MSKQTDIEIANKAKLLPIEQIAKKLNISIENIERYGKYKAKLSLDILKNKAINRSNLILVTAITPTPAGEGKTTVSIGLNDGLNRIGKKSVVVIREPSLGPVFGIKGGAAGGGAAQVVPMEDINLHFTGDFSAIEKANNLLAALIDNELHHNSNSLQIDPRSIKWKRVLDMNDRALRSIVVGLGGSTNGIARETGFNITPASEVMAILCMAENLSDLKNRLGNILVGFTYNNKPVYARDLKAENAMTILLKDAIKPNLVQTLENNPAIIHGGPFANIAQGTNSILATKMGLSLADYVVTEAGFGSDLGAEKFFNLKCVSAQLKPKAVVLVATIRALRYHGGSSKNNYHKPSVHKVKKGLSNLQKHIENIQAFGINPVVAINHFTSDTKKEIDLVINECNQLGVTVIVDDEYSASGIGSQSLAEAVIQSIEKNNNSFHPLYDWNLPIKEKIKRIATKIYGAKKVNYLPKAQKGLKEIEALGLTHLPVCMAKTQKSLSDNAKLRGRPKHFSITIREFEYALGAGFIIPILGDIMRMPGLPNHPASENMRIDNNGNIDGLS